MIFDIKLLILLEDETLILLKALKKNQVYCRVVYI